MKCSLLSLALAASSAQAQIYHCDTPQGPVYSDARCGEEAELVTIEDESSGIADRSPEEARAWLAEQRAGRAEERENRQRAQGLQSQAPVVVPVERPVAYPVFWPRRGHARPPHRAPRPEPPAPPPVEPDPPSSVLRPPDHDGG